jgi:hypothetical protein
METTNHLNEAFRLNIIGYMLPLKPGCYFDNNWLNGSIEIKDNSGTEKISLEFLQVEELLMLLDWLQEIQNRQKRKATSFYFVDPYIKFRIWKRGKVELLKFFYHSGKQVIYSWEMILNQENVKDFKRQINQILREFPLR